MKENIINFLNSQFISSIIGVLVGGLLTIKINSIVEKKRILLGLKVKMWEEVSDSLENINSYLIKIDTEFECYKKKIDNSNLNTLNNVLNKNYKLIESNYSNLNDVLCRNTLIAPKCVDLTDDFDKNLKLFLKYIVKFNKTSEIDNNLVEKSIDELIKSYVNLYSELQYNLLKDILNKKSKKEVNQVLKIREKS